jgi:hypothetical protein
MSQHSLADCHAQSKQFICVSESSIALMHSSATLEVTYVTCEQASELEDTLRKLWPPLASAEHQFLLISTTLQL